MQFDRLKRREFMTLLGGATAAWPLSARAQQPSPVRPLIGLLSPLSAAAASRNVVAFRSALRDLGYVEGRNLTLALRYGDGHADRMPLLAQELVALNPDVILAGAKSGALAAYNATRTIPIVTITEEDPVTAGLAQSLARPGGKVTEHGTLVAVRVWIFLNSHYRPSHMLAQCSIPTNQGTSFKFQNCPLWRVLSA
jgi:putative ABC transport system substrate-binding protein